MDLTPLKKDACALLGIPFDEKSSHLRGAAQGPEKIRSALNCGAMNLFTENNLKMDLTDLGDLKIPRTSEFVETIEHAVLKILSKSTRVICLGGDHSITYPIVKAHAEIHKDLNILHFDAHPDLYEEYDQDPLSHACPFARIMGDGLAKSLTQIGIRAMNPLQREQAKRYNVKVFEMKDKSPINLSHLKAPLYLSFDLDALDPAFAPGVSHQEPGGLCTREAISLIQSLPVPILGADMVELNPVRDPSGITAAAGAKLLKEIYGAMHPV